jgi:hypothetical protein
VTAWKLPDSTGNLLALLAFIVMRHTLGGPLLFRSEIIGEDITLLLILAFWLAPSKFKPTISYAMGSVINITMVLLIWTMPARKSSLAETIFSTAVFALFASYGAVLAVRKMIQ